MNKVAANFTGSIPEFYESGLVPVIFEDYAREIAALVAKRKPEKVLELAAGTGVVTRLLRDRLSRKCEIIASDLNEPMLEVARKKFKSGESVSFQSIDAMSIPLDDNSVDVVACQFGVMFFPDKVESYCEALRVLKPGGRYIFNAWDSHEHNPFAGIAQSLVEKAFPDDPPGFYKVPFHYHDVREMKREMKEAGFSSVKVQRRKIRKTIPSIAAFAQGLVHGNPLSEEIRARSSDPDAMVDVIRSAFEAAFGSDPAKMPLSAFFVTGQK